MRLFRKSKIKKVSVKDMKKIEMQLDEQKNCCFCGLMKQEIKECMEKSKVKNNLRSMLKHEIKCKDCRARIKMMADCKTKGHK